MPEETTKLTAVTYNVHRCVGGDGRKDAVRVAHVLDALEFDIAALQEVESGEVLGEPPLQLSVLAQLTKTIAIAGPTIESAEEDYGNAVLVRGEVLHVERHDLSVDGREPRGILDVQVRVRGVELRCLATHLGLGIRERRGQMAKLLEIAREERSLPTLLMGDFNEWFPWARSRRRMKEHFGRVPMLGTFPAHRPLLSLDHIWVRPSNALQRLSVVSSPEARRASDHLPLEARLEFPVSRESEPASASETPGAK